jgi:hypothetical protein
MTAPIETAPPAVRTGEGDGTDERVTTARTIRDVARALPPTEDRAANRLHDLADQLQLPALSARPLVSGTVNRDDVMRLRGKIEGVQLAARFLTDPALTAQLNRHADELLALLGGYQAD